jgi:hypothetical protein
MQPRHGTTRWSRMKACPARSASRSSVTCISARPSATTGSRSSPAFRSCPPCSTLSASTRYCATPLTCRRSRRRSCMWVDSRSTSGWTLSCGSRTTSKQRCISRGRTNVVPWPRFQRLSSVPLGHRNDQHRPCLHHHAWLAAFPQRRLTRLPFRYRLVPSAVSHWWRCKNVNDKDSATTATSLMFAGTNASGSSSWRRPTTSTTTFP